MTNRHFPIVAKHLGCSTVDIIMFYNGHTEILSTEQKLKLGEMIDDLYNNRNIPRGGFYDDGQKWSSKIE